MIDADPESLNAQKDATHAGELVEAAEEFVEEADELLRRALRRQHRESHDIGEEDAAKEGKSEGNGNRYDAGVILDAELECEALSHLPFQHLILRATN